MHHAVSSDSLIYRPEVIPGALKIDEEECVSHAGMLEIACGYIAGVYERCLPVDGGLLYLS